MFILLCRSAIIFTIQCNEILRKYDYPNLCEPYTLRTDVTAPFLYFQPRFGIWAEVRIFRIVSTNHHYFGGSFNVGSSEDNNG